MTGGTLSAMSVGLFDSVRLGPVTLKNRILKSATFEGVTPRGFVTSELIEFHRQVAVGGAALTTVAFLAVASEGRTNRGAVCVAPHTLAGLAEIAEAAHAEGALASAQLGHAGPVADARSNRVLAIGPGGSFNPLSLKRTRALDDRGIAAVIDAFGDAASGVAEAGFDAVELHLGHNYLPSAFLSPRLNNRRDRWGGCLENRARLCREIVLRVRARVGSEVAVLAKFNMVDGYSGGLNIDDALRVASWLEGDGGLDAMVLTGGSSLVNPMFLFRGTAPRASFTREMPPWLRPAFRLGGDRFLREYRYEDGYFRDLALRFRNELKLPLIYLGGVSERETAEVALADGFEFVAMARALLIDPALPNRWRSGDGAGSGCTHCNECMPTIYSGTRCVLRDAVVPARLGGRP